MRALRVAAFLAVSLLAGPVLAQVENKDYELLEPPQPTSTPGKVEVVEFFSYGCPHCYAMQPLISKWEAELPKNAVLIRVPVAFGRAAWGQLSRAYYALKAMGQIERLDAAIFEAIHKEGQPLFDEEHLTAWVAKHGVDPDKFRTEFNSFGVTTQATRAEQMSRAYKVTGIPYLSVDGKYTVLGTTYQEMLENARALIDKASAERQAANRD